jgi:hypothetical protein
VFTFVRCKPVKSAAGQTGNLLVMFRGPENGRQFRASKGEAQLLGFSLCRAVLVPGMRASEWDRVVPVWRRWMAGLSVLA